MFSFDMCLLNGRFRSVGQQATDGTGTRVERLRGDMDSPEIAAIVENQRLANAVGVQSMPSFAIGNELISGAMDLSRLRS